MRESFLSTWRSGVTPGDLGALVALLHQQVTPVRASVKSLSALVSPNHSPTRAQLGARRQRGRGRPCVDQAKNAPMSAPLDASSAGNKNPA
jgi:hypothetical protein